MEQQTPIPLQEPIPAPEPISLDTGSGSPILTKEALERRVFMAQFGLSDMGYEPDYLKSSIEMGQEDTLRQDASAKLNASDAAARSEVVRDFLNNKVGPPNADDVKFIEGTAPMEYTPKDVIERRYGEQYISELDKYILNKDNEHFWNIFRDYINPENKAVREYGSSTMARHMYLRKKLEEIDAKLSNQSYGGFALDFAKMAFPVFNPYTELKFRNNVPGGSLIEGGLLGENLEKQRDRLWQLPFAKFQDVVDKIVEQVGQGTFTDNPLAAKVFIQSMLGQTTPERVMGNLNTITTAMDIPAIFKIGSGVYKSAKLTSDARKAVADIIEASKNPNATKADILASVGNVGDAAIVDASAIVARKIDGSITQTEEGLEALSRFFRIDKENLRNDASLADGLKGMLLEQYDIAEGSILQTMLRIMRPMRIPVEKLPEEILVRLKANTAARYPGISNDILTLSDPVYEPLSSTWNITARVGNGAELFESDIAAVNYARMHGLRVSLSKEQMGHLDAHITELEKTEKMLRRMDADTSGLNKYYDVADELKALKAKREELNKPGGYRVDSQGGGYFIEFTANMKENDRLLRDFLAPQQFTVNKDGEKVPNPYYRAEADASSKGLSQYIPFWNYASHYARMADDTLSLESNEARKASLYPQAVLFKVFKQEEKYIRDIFAGKIRFDETTGEEFPWYRRAVSSAISPVTRFLRKEEWRRFKDTLDYSQKAPDPDNDGIPGYFFKDANELSAFYLNRYQESPSPAFIHGYMAIKRWYEMERVLREIGEYRYRARVGSETHEVKIKGPDGVEKISQSFDAVSRNTIPKTGSMIVIESDGKAKTVDLSRLNQKQRDMYFDEVKNGRYKILEIYDQESRPFNGFVPQGEKVTRYVMARNVETRPLEWKQVPRRGGGHEVPDYAHYIKQAKIRSERIGGTLNHTYEGDQTFMPIGFRAMGEDVANKMNVVRRMLNDGKNDEAKAYASAHLPFEWKKIRDMFYESRDAEGRVFPPLFNLKEDFKVVPKNRTIFDLDKDITQRYGTGTKEGGTFVDGTREGLARNFQVEFTGRRDARELFTLDNDGSARNPAYRIRDIERIDPLQMMNRATNRIIRSTFFEDYKIAAVETWVQQALPYLKETDSVVLSSPFYHFRTANVDSFKSAVDKDTVHRLLGNKFKIEQLVGTPSELQSFLHTWAQKTADLTYGAFGPRAASKLTPIWLVDKLKDPFATFRSLAFNAYLGFMYIPQLWIQMAGFVNIFAHSPRYAGTATWANVLHQYARFNSSPKFLDYLDNMATKMRLPGMPKYRPGEWKEAFETLQNSGFGIVGRELSLLDTMSKARVYESGSGRILDAMQLPFKEGERQGRFGAWFTAMKEFRDANPTGKITQADMAKIVNRADLLYNNMSVASHSLFNEGVFSLPMQFLQYAKNLGEIFFSKRIGDTLTQRNMVRARLIAANWMMFGAPMAAGVTGFPLSDWLRQKAIEAGYVANRDRAGAKDWIDHLAMEGLPATFIAMATGNTYNIGQRYGSGGVTPILDLLGDTGFWKIVGGVSGQTVARSVGNLSGVIMAMGSLIRRAPDEVGYKLKVEDFLDIFNEAQIVNKTRAWWTAMNTGVWVNKNMDKIKDVGKIESTLMYVFGTSPAEQSDSRHIMANLQSQLEAEKEGIKLMEREINRFMIASSDGDNAQASDYYRRAFAIGEAYNLKSDQIANSVARALKGREPLIERVSWEALMKHAPKGKEEQYRQMYGEMRRHSQTQRERLKGGQ